MMNWQYCLLAAAGVSALVAWVLSVLRKNKARRQRDFTRNLETLLQPREKVKVICPQKGGRCILTSSRIILERKGEFSAYPVKSIRKLQGTNAAGNRTTVPGKMVQLTVKLDKEIVLRNTGAEFEELTACLLKQVKKQQEKKQNTPRK